MRALSAWCIGILAIAHLVPGAVFAREVSPHELLPLSFWGALRRVEAIPGAKVTFIHHTQIWWTAIATVKPASGAHRNATAATISITGTHIAGYASPVLDAIEYATHDGLSFYAHGGSAARRIGERVFGTITYADFMAALPLQNVPVKSARAYAGQNAFREYAVSAGRVNSLRIAIRHVPGSGKPDLAALKRLIANRNDPPIGKLLADPDAYTFAEATYKGRIVFNDPASLFEEIIVPDFNAALPCYRLQVRFGFGRSEQAGYPIIVTGTLMEPLHGTTAALDGQSYYVTTGVSTDKICDETRRR